MKKASEKDERRRTAKKKKEEKRKKKKKASERKAQFGILRPNITTLRTRRQGCAFGQPDRSTNQIYPQDSQTVMTGE